jgi:hypothetical protein
MEAFNGCTSLVNVTFLGNIRTGLFSDYYSRTFPGDLRAKYYYLDSVNGTPGTYTRPSGSSNAWTRQ